MCKCDTCKVRVCLNSELRRFPAGCPSVEPFQGDAREVALGVEREPMCASHATTRYGYGRLTRVEEIMVFARESSYTRIGVAFCIALVNEARIFCDVLRDNGFEALSILCKTGALPREALGELFVCDCQPGMQESLCNPIGQAYALANAKSQLNVVLGLCVGHDSLFMKYSSAPVTYLAVKDRVTGHNPLSPIYQHEGLFERIHHADIPDTPHYATVCSNEREGVEA